MGKAHQRTDHVVRASDDVRVDRRQVAECFGDLQASQRFAHGPERRRVARGPIAARIPAGLRDVERHAGGCAPHLAREIAVAAFDAFVIKKISETPAVDFTGTDGVRHTSWTISSADEIAFVEVQFAQIPFLYIADGHHRSAAAGRVFKSRNGAGHSGQFLSVIFPHNQMQILPYNRVLKDLNGLTPGELISKLEKVFETIRVGEATPKGKHELGLFIEGKWHRLTFKREFTMVADPIEKLDVTLLQKHVLAPVFGIDDPRTSKKINFVGGIRGTAELEKLVNSGEYACAFSMFPTSIEDLMQIADAGGIMPPKSTWFEPKLRDAMFCHLIS